MKRYTNSEVFTKKQVFIALIATLMISSVVVQSNQIAFDQDVKRVYSFPAPVLETIDIAGTIYDRVAMEDCYSAGSAGEPVIPSKGIFLLLPPESTVSEITVLPGEKIVLGVGFTIEPTSQAIPMSQTEGIPIPAPNQAIYQSDAFYPGNLFTTVGVQSFRGYHILILLLHPIQYNPVTGELYYYTSLEVSVKTLKNTTPSALYRGLPQDIAAVQQKVDNPEMTFQYHHENTNPPTPFESYDLLIITTDALKTSFQPLKEAHDTTGVITVIKTLTDIGASDLESIRNYIRTAYTDWGIEYVLIGGDTNVVAAPMLWVSGMDENVTYYEETMPSDLYYACLDGPYNYDGDNKWGEPTDGANGGDVDLIADVYVGRACVGTTAEVNNFVTKTVAYINRDINDPYLKKVCLAAEYLGNYGIASYGGTYMDQLVNGSSDDGYTTVGISTDDYVITKLYDAPGYDWPPSAIITIINNGVHIINHLGHAYYTYNLKLDNYDVDGLTNPANRTCFIYSQGCMAGGFDNGDCIAEYFTVKNTHGAFACVMNARYGFFWSYSTDGDSQRFHRQFWDAVFGENLRQIGRANHDSKEDNLPIIGRSCIRWVYYETNLFGDPALTITETTNHPPDKPVLPSGPTSGTTNIDYTFSSSTTDPDAGDQLYYLWDWGDGTQSAWLGPYTSGQSVQATHRWMTEGAYLVKVKAKDTNGVESVWSDSITIQIAEGPRIEIGMISGGLRVSAEIKNTGLVEASDVNWTIALQGLVFFGQKKSGTLADINPGASSEISTGFIFGLGSVEILVTAAEVEKTVSAFLFGPFILNIR
jgi:hypothetical protein